MQKWKPDSRFTLRESSNDGTLEFQKGDPCGPWRNVESHEREALLERERERQDWYNDFLGENAGKIVVIMGTGPMMKRITKKWAKHVAERKDIVVFGVNACPKVCKNIWGYDPDKLFDGIVGADAVHPNIWQEWGWDLLKTVPRFCKRRSYARHWIPVKSASNPVPAASDLYYRDSVTASMNLALISIATEKGSKDCAGPYLTWPQARMRRADGGRVLLLGVEHNRFDHCYTDRADFRTYDEPGIAWPILKNKIEAHKQLSSFAHELGAEVYIGAPWSVIDMHPSVDAEEFLSIPAKIRCGLTTSGPPEQQKRVTSAADCVRYQDAKIAWMEGGKKGAEPKAPKKVNNNGNISKPKVAS